MPKTIKTTALRDNLAAAISQTKKESILLITKNNKHVGALIDIDYLEDLLFASNNEFVESIQAARASKKKYTLEEAFSDLS